MTLQPKKILLMGAGFTTHNMGVWALASGAIESALYAYPNCKIVLFDYNSFPDTYNVRYSNGTTLVHLANIRFSKKFWHKNNIFLLFFIALITRMIPINSVKKKIISNNIWLNHIQTSDIVGSVAGGDSFSDIYGFARFIYIGLPLILVLLLGKPLILLPQTIGPFSNKMIQIIAKLIITKAKKVYSRDSQESDKVAHYYKKNQKKIYFSYDLGFVMEPYITKERLPPWLAEYNNDNPLVGINISGLLFIGGYTRNNMFGLKIDYKPMIHAVINHFIRKYNANVMLIPHVFGWRENKESDLTACQEIFQEVNTIIPERLHIIMEEYNQHEIKAIIGKCDFFLGSRMHSCIAALSQGVPAVGLAYSKKFQGVFRSISMEKMVIDLREQELDAIIRIIDRAYEQRKETRLFLEKKMLDVRRSVLKLFSDL